MAPRAMYVNDSLTSTFTSKQSAPRMKRLMPGRSRPPKPADAARSTGLPFHFLARFGTCARSDFRDLYTLYAR